MTALWYAIRHDDGKVAEIADSKSALMWLLTTNHMDEDGHARRSGTPGTYNYTAPRGQGYTVTNVRPNRPRFFTFVNAFYCFSCMGAEDALVEADYPGAEEIVGQDYEDGGFYCCNCGRDSDDNQDAHRPGYAIGGPSDFVYTDYDQEA